MIATSPLICTLRDRPLTPAGPPNRWRMCSGSSAAAGSAPEALRVSTTPGHVHIQLAAPSAHAATSQCPSRLLGGRHCDGPKTQVQPVQTAPRAGSATQDPHVTQLPADIAVAGN